MIPHELEKNFTRFASVAIFHIALWFVITVWGVFMFFAVILDTFSEIRNKQVITLFSFNNQVFDAKANFVISLPFAVNCWLVWSPLNHQIVEHKWIWNRMSWHFYHKQGYFREQWLLNICLHFLMTSLTNIVVILPVKQIYLHDVIFISS